VNLLERQDALQVEARELVDRHRIEDFLSGLGRVVPIGSAVTGLMVWRDIDYCVELEREDVWPALLPVLERCSAVEYADEPERHYFVLRLDGWKVDVSLFKEGLPPGVAPYPTGLDDETRLLILQLKDAWRRRHPDEELLWSFELYDAVLNRGARTLDEVERLIPTRSSPAAST
jgi:hypothetical protein